MERQNNLEDNPTVLEALRNWLGFAGQTEREFEPRQSAEGGKKHLLWLALALFVLGQLMIEFGRQTLLVLASLFFVCAFILAALSLINREKQTQDADEVIQNETEDDVSISVKTAWLVLGLALAILGGWNYRNGTVNLLAALLWIGSIASVFYAFYQKRIKERQPFKARLQKILSNRKRLMALLFLIVVVLAFQLGGLKNVPSEMVSSQVEAYYTYDGILSGDTALWFPRNVVSEPLGYYWGALLNLFAGKPLSFTGLKLAYALAGLIAVFFIYKLGSLLFDERSGYLSALLFGIGFWPILQERALLGYGLVLVIFIPATFFLIKSLKEDDFNSLLIATVLTSLGLLTNKIFIFAILANILVTIVYTVKKVKEGQRTELALRIGVSIILGVVVALPLVFVIISNPSGWLAPIANQLSTQFSSYSASKSLVFFSNLLSALGMVNWSNNNSWVDGIANRGALDWLSAAFFLFGLAVLIFKDFRKDRSQTIALLLIFLVMLMPSVLSFSQPQENPSLSRALGAALPVFLIAGRGFGFALEQLPEISPKKANNRRTFVFLLFAAIAIFNNYQLINRVYAENYHRSAWNASEMASVLNENMTGREGNLQPYLVGYPYWVDARAVAISMGKPELNLSILPDDLAQTVNLNANKIFLLHPEDESSLNQLQSLYPHGFGNLYASREANKDFYVFIVSQ